jgi:predicted AAA+ superfamily ATPase
MPPEHPTAHHRPHIKRALRDPLATLVAQSTIELQGPRGVGKRTLARQLGADAVTTTHRRHAPPTPGARRVRVHPLTVRELGLTTPSHFTTLLKRGGLPAQVWADPAPDALPDALKWLLKDSNGLSEAMDEKTGAGLWASLMGSVGRPLSVRAIAGAAGVNERRALAWTDTFHAQHAVFRLAPLPSPTAGATFRALKKGQKHYPYDWSQARTRHAQLEALVANHLLQWVESSADLANEDKRLVYFRDCDQREVDFVILDNNRPALLVQVDPVADTANRHLAYLARKFPQAQAWQLSLDAPMAPVQLKRVSIAHPLRFLMGLC